MATEVVVRPGSALTIEQNGINVITESERKGRPRDLFWPWCAANIAVLGISYGSFLLGFGISFWQATLAGIIGTILSVVASCWLRVPRRQARVSADDRAQRSRIRRARRQAPGGVVLHPAGRLGD